MKKELQIISFNYPYPPSYGGLIDVYYKIKALSELGVTIHLHCFVENIPAVIDEEVASLVDDIFFYRKKRNPLLFLYKDPFSVKIRTSKILLQNVEKIDAPVLFEGLQTSGIAKYLKHKSNFLRLHNNEEAYYKGLSQSEENFVKKIVYYFESYKYRFYQKSKFALFETVFCLSQKEYNEVNSNTGNASLIGIFHGNTHVKILEGRGEYFLFHGDLSISDNRKALYSVIEVFEKLPQYNLVVASDKATPKIKQNLSKHQNIKLVPIENQDNLNLLLSHAQANILLSYQKSGTKVKLFNTLFNSRFTIINDNITDDPQLINLCTLINDKTELRDKIIEIATQDFKMYSQKQIVLENNYSDLNMAKRMADIIFKDQAGQ